MSSETTGTKRTLEKDTNDEDEIEQPPAKRQRQSASNSNSTNDDSKEKEKDSEKNGSQVDINLYCAWFCPFAQRAWLALLLKKVNFKYNETDPYDKSKEWLAINPRGLVPAIVDFKSDKNGKHIIYESSIILEYLDDMYKDSNYHLYPTNSYEKAMARIWIDHINKKIIRHFYSILQFKEKDKQAKAVEDFFDGMDKLIMAMDENGPFFSGKAINAVDINILPWGARLFLLKHYRDIDYTDYIGKSVKQNGNGNKLLDRYNKWWNACAALKEFQATKASDKDYIAKYKRYADNNAKTLVAVAVNKGLPLP